MNRIGIVGCGWLGERIAETLCDKYSIYSTTTSQEKFERLQAKGINPSIAGFSDDPDMPDASLWKEAENMDVVIITVPFSDRNSSAESLSVKVKNLSSFLGAFKGQMFFMSSTSVYPDTLNEFVESDLLIDNIVSEGLIRSTYPQVNILRLAGLMGGTRLLKNYRVSNLDLPVNHIHYVDVCAVIECMIGLRSTSKVYNVVAPMHPSKEAVINAQRGESYAEDGNAEGRTISCHKLVAELDFSFKYPDPRLFHL